MIECVHNADLEGEIAEQGYLYIQEVHRVHLSKRSGENFSRQISNQASLLADYHTHSYCSLPLQYYRSYPISRQQSNVNYSLYH